MNYIAGNVLYRNPLSEAKDIQDFVLEGKAKLAFPSKSLRMSSVLDASLGQQANYVLWCPETFPDQIEICWQFRPIAEPGLCILFFAAKGKENQDLFSPGLQNRTGVYDQYHSGDIDCLHVSYFRRMWESERCFHTCNLRKSYGFHLVAQGADPLPDVADAKGFYQMRLIKLKEQVTFWIENLEIFSWRDTNAETGKMLTGGKVGFRQMAPMTGEYRELIVRAIRSGRTA